MRWHKTGQSGKPDLSPEAFARAIAGLPVQRGTISLIRAGLAAKNGGGLNAMAAEQKKKRRKRSPKQQATELLIEGRREKAAKLKLAGWSMRDIAGHLKCSVGTVHSDIAEVFRRTRDEADGAVERARMLSLARLDVATKGIWSGVEAGDLDAVDRLVRLEARRAKLEGLDAPAKSEVVVGTSSPADAARLVREAFGEKALPRDVEPQDAQDAGPVPGVPTPR